MNGATGRRLVCVVIAFGAAACSSKAATPTTVASSTTAASTGSVHAYLTGPGAAIVTVERASQALATGKQPTRSTCTAFLASASTIVSSTTWARVLRAVPGASLRTAIVTDLNDKLFLARACVSTTGLDNSADEQHVYALYATRSRALATRFAALGISLS
jgi:hypothetical protein